MNILVKDPFFENILPIELFELLARESKDIRAGLNPVRVHVGNMFGMFVREPTTRDTDDPN
jgi:hypothetical protein